MRSHAIFIGQVRDVATFKSSIEMMVRLRSEELCHRIIYSDWCGELEPYDGLRTWLEQRRVDIIELPPMIDKGPSNILTQIRSLEAALANIDDEEFVLKMRPDSVLKEGLARRLLSGACFRAAGPIREDLPKVFDHRIWIPWFHTSRCFHCSDEGFFGKRRDLRHLQSFSLLSPQYGPSLSLIHVTRFLPPFLSVFPVFEDYLACYANVRALQGADRLCLPMVRVAEQVPNERYLIGASMVERLLSETDTFVRILALYYKIIRWYFCVDGGQNGDDFFVRRGPKPHEQVRGNDGLSNIVRNGDLCVRAYTRQWVDALEEGECNSSELGRRLSAEMRRADTNPVAAGARTAPEDIDKDRRVASAAVRRYVTTNWGGIVRRRVRFALRTRNFRGTRR